MFTTRPFWLHCRSFRVISCYRLRLVAKSALPRCRTCRRLLEAGYPNSNYSFWIGVFAPAKTPRPIIDKLNTEISKALQVPAVRRNSRRSAWS